MHIINYRILFLLFGGFMEIFCLVWCWFHCVGAIWRHESGVSGQGCSGVLGGCGVVLVLKRWWWWWCWKRWWCCKWGQLHPTKILFHFSNIFNHNSKFVILHLYRLKKIQISII